MPPVLVLLSGYPTGCLLSDLSSHMHYPLVAVLLQVDGAPGDPSVMMRLVAWLAGSGHHKASKQVGLLCDKEPRERCHRCPCE
jgi:hypothetical protein